MTPFNVFHDCQNKSNGNLIHGTIRFEGTAYMGILTLFEVRYTLNIQPVKVSVYYVTAFTTK